MTKPWERFADPADLPEAEQTEAAAPKPWERYQQMDLSQRVGEDVTSMGVMGESAARGILDNALNLPNAVGDVIGNTASFLTAGIRTGAERAGELVARTRFNLATGEPTEEPLTPLGETFGDRLESARLNPTNQALMRGLDMPTSIDLQAAGATALQNMPAQPLYPGMQPNMMTPNQPAPKGEFEQTRDAMLEGYIQRREMFPAAAGTGDIIADAGSLYMVRAPGVNLQRLRRRNQELQPDTPMRKIDPGVKRFLDRKVTDLKDRFGKAGYEIAETGAEGAVLAALQDESPVAGAAFGAGVQAINNIAVGVYEEVDTATGKMGFKPGMTRHGINAAIVATAGASLFQLVKELVPGGRDRILESEESGYAKAAAAMAAGAFTVAAGFSRPSKMQLDDLGLMVDTWHSARRGAVMGTFNEIMNDDSGDSERIMDQINRDASYFDTVPLERINKAWRNEDVSMTDTIETLMESDRNFRRKVLALREQQ